MKLHKEKGITVILVSHNMEDISRMANRLIVMHQGQVLLDGNPIEIFHHDRETLQSAGVDVPPLSQTLQALADRQIPVNIDRVHVQEAVEDLYAYVKEVRHVK